jgi:flagellar motor switch protein FliM
MSLTTLKNAGKERMLKMLSKMPAAKTAEPAPADCSDYNWLEPHCFGDDQLEKINIFAKTLEEKINTRLKNYFGQNFKVEFDSTVQFFCEEQNSSENQSTDYCLGFSGETGSIFGLVNMPAETAAAWTSHILGDTHTEQQQNAELSSLERSLLHDIAAEVVNSIALAIPHGKIKPQGCITESSAAMNFTPGQEVCRLAFKFTMDNSEKKPFNFSYLVLCEHITNVVLAGNAAKISADPAKTRETIIRNLKNVTIPLSSILCRQVFSLGELLSLEADDVIVFDKKTSDSVDVLVDGKTSFYGMLAKNNNNYAVVIDKIKK